MEFGYGPDSFAPMDVGRSILEDAQMPPGRLELARTPVSPQGSVAVIGGGPGGLYFALLLKQRVPDLSVSVYERAPADSTFGWGVVFSDQTLRSLGTADPPTHARILAALTRWESLTFVHRGVRVPILGYHFSAIRRLDLLRILQQRCSEVGVKLHFGHAMSRPDEIVASAPLVVAADGAHSTVRSHWRHQFGTSIHRRSQRYLWCGTTRHFESLLLIFRETPWGVLSAHAYPYGPGVSTFIVECSEDTWRRAGFDRPVDDAVLATLSRIFDEDLCGHALQSAQREWSGFAVVTNAHWHLGHVVLLGDALHTAHFSIGSGTKMAMEDAIALVDALCASSDLRQAFHRYAEERSGPIRRLQDAAWRSMIWFERIDELLAVSPVELAYLGLTRTGRVAREQLLSRDPRFMETYEGVRSTSGPEPSTSAEIASR